MWKIIEHVVKKHRLENSCCDWDKTLWQCCSQLLSSQTKIYVWYPFCLHILSFDTTCMTALNRCLSPWLLSICYYYCHLPHSSSLPPAPPATARPLPLPPMSPLHSHSDLWLLILYLSTRRTGAQEMTCFCLGWRDTHTHLRMHAHTHKDSTHLTHWRLRRAHNVIIGKQSSQLHTWVQLGSELGCYSDTDGKSQELVC